MEIRGHRLLKEGAWVTFGQVGSAIGALVGLRLLTEYLEPAVFGFATLLLGVVALGQGLAVNPLMQAVLRYYPDFSLAGEVHVLRTTVARTLRTIMVWISALLCLGAFAYAAMTGDWLWLGLAVLMAAIFSIEGARSLELTLFNAARRQRPMALWSVVEAWARPVAVVAAVVFLTAQVSAVLIGYLIASVAAYLLFFRVAVQKNDSAGEGGLGREDGRIVRNLWSYALPLVPVAAAGWASGLADRYFVGGLLGLAEAGSYAAVYALVSRPFLMLSGIIEQTVRPVYYDAVTAGNSERSRAILKAWLMLSALGGGIGFALALLLHEQFAAWLLAEPYRMSAGLMPWIAAGYWLLILSHVFTRICYAHHDTKSVFWIEATGALLAIVVIIPAIRLFGLAGAAMAVPMYFGAQLGLAMMLARRSMQHRSSILPAQ